ncbi:hypothetical protein SZ63_05595 [Methanoculleus sediminis]|uniref:Uncharacterized protein n=1 Tax=Methanoculleus sediminis TaxID=1550566 RepID=A0A0H1R009_9EURY|nr:hypothetical protein SZ63_05595 [Methanoculleus sediminis]
MTICFIDLDLNQDGSFKLPREKVFEILHRFDSFTVRTRSGGFHIYFAITAPEAWEVCKQYGENAVLKHDGVNYGEFRLTNQYVVGVGSYIPVNDQSQSHGYREEATGYYEVEIDKPIRFISADDLGTLLHKKTCTTPPISTGGGVWAVNHDQINEIKPDNIINAYGKTLEEVRAQDIKLDNLLSGAGASLTSKTPEKEPDKSEMDYAAVSILKGHGFTPEQTWVILRKYRPYAKMLERDDYLERTIGKVYKNGSSFTSSPTITSTAGDPSDTETEEIVLSQFPDKLSTTRPCIHLLGLPRTGKSYFAQKILGTEYSSGVYVAPSHEILKQQYARFIQQFPKKTCVRLVGKGQESVCTYVNDQGKKCDCAHCLKMPKFNTNETKKDGSSISRDDIITWWEMEKVAKKVVLRYKHIDPTTFTQEEFHKLLERDGKKYCPYYLLHFCEREVDYVFTTQYYTTVPDENESITSIKKREVCVIDEDPSFRFYLPRDFALVEYSCYPASTKIKNNLFEYAEPLNHLKSYVMHVYEKDKNGKMIQKAKQRLKEHEKIILDLINYVETVQKCISEFKDKYAEMEFNELVDALEEIQILPNDERESSLYQDEATKQMILKEIEQYERKQGFGGEQESESGFLLRPLFEILLYPLMPSPYCTIGRNPQTLYLVGDKEKIIREPRCADKYILIGFSEAGQFAKQLFPNPTDRICYRIDSFPYKQNFTLVVVCGKDAKEQQRLTMSFIRKLIEKNRSSAWKVPSMILTSSQKQQEALAKRLPDGTTYACRKDEINTYLQKWCEGNAEIFYQNSTISRGIDIPWMDVLIVHSCNFAQPYPKAVIDNCDRALKHILTDIKQEKERLDSLDPKEPGYSDHVREIQNHIDELKDLHFDMAEPMEDKKYHAKVIQHSSLVDETTNSVLRPTPVNGKRTEQAKFIIIQGKEEMYLKSELTHDMREICITSEKEASAVIDLIYDSVTKVNSEAIMLKGTGHALTEITDYTDADIERASEIDGIQFGKSYHEVAPLIEELKAELKELNEEVDSPDGQDQKSDIVGIVEKLVKHPAFGKWTKEKQRTGSISVSALIRWVRSRRREPYSLASCREAVNFLVQQKWVSVKRSSLVREHSTLERDNARRNDTLYMTKANINAIHEGSLGKITINPKPSN